MKLISNKELPMDAEAVNTVRVNSQRLKSAKINLLTKDVLDITSEIKNTYPELYKFLDETPVNEISYSSDKIVPEEIENYLNTLKTHLHNHFNTHQLNEKHFIKLKQESLLT